MVSTRKARERARCALRGVEKAAVWREVKIRRPDVVVGVPRGLVRAGRPDGSARRAGDELGVRGQRRHGVEFLERPGVRVERQRGDHAGQLVEQIDEAVVGRNDQVTRPCTLLELEDRRRVRGEPSALFVEQELEHLVGAKVRHEHKAVRVVGADGMRIARRRDDLEQKPPMRLALAPGGLIASGVTSDAGPTGTGDTPQSVNTTLTLSPKRLVRQRPR